MIQRQCESTLANPLTNNDRQRLKCRATELPTQNLIMKFVVNAVAGSLIESKMLCSEADYPTRSDITRSPSSRRSRVCP